MLRDQQRNVREIPLHATSDSGLKAGFYVREGPAEIVGAKLVFTKIPPRSALPIRVTVVAWQYGAQGKFKSAEPVIREFFIGTK